ncbi:MAG: ABC transporter ATP-binding protein [Janthinobacterium lividum]
MIELRHIGVIFHEGTALESQIFSNLNLKIDQGEVVTVIGGNGAGKSTLLKVIAGDVLPSEGQVLIEGQDVTSVPSHRRAALVSRVFQDPRLGSCPALTIEENMALALGRGQRPGLKLALTSQRRRLFKDLLAPLNLGLENRLDLPMGLLSGGQRQTICLFMAVLAPSEILVLDEHTAALDPKNSLAIIQLTQQLIQEKKLTVLMVTHSMHQALSLGHRTLMLNEGQIVLDLQGQERNTMTEKNLIELFKQKIHNLYVEDEFLIND